jgi:hypothetical protein
MNGKPDPLPAATRCSSESVEASPAGWGGIRPCFGGVRSGLDLPAAFPGILVYIALGDRCPSAIDRVKRRASAAGPCYDPSSFEPCRCHGRSRARRRSKFIVGPSGSGTLNRCTSKSSVRRRRAEPGALGGSTKNPTVTEAEIWVAGRIGRSWGSTRRCPSGSW